ncbi:MAG: DUF4160 domain-containing protein [Firmicutes bacterium]|nr:DUF4160 domain-containing protein [Bacillota bacterium]
MPTLYDYLGIKFFFFGNEHKPIHIHAEYGGARVKVSFFLQEGNVYRTTYKAELGKFPPNKLKELKKIVSVYKTQLIQKWIDFFYFRKKF